MELTRLRRMVRARWWLVVAMAAIGAVAAIAFTNYSNDNIEPRYAAIATIDFIVGDAEDLPEEETPTQGRGGSGGESDSPAADLVEAAAAAALEASPTLLDGSTPGVAVTELPEQGKLQFSAQSPSEQAAREIVAQLLDDYLEVDPTSVDVQVQIDLLVVEATEINERLAAFEPPPDPEPEPIPPDVQAQMNELQSRIGTVEGGYGAVQGELSDALAVPEDERDEELIAELEAELERIRMMSADLIRQLEAITPPEPEIPEFVLTPEQELEKTALEARMDEISTQFLELQDQAESTDSIEVSEIVVTDETDSPSDPMIAILVGLLGGVVAGIGLIIGLDRLQGTVWSASDMAQVPVLAEVPQHASRIQLRGRRYEEVRQNGVQSVRSAILGLYHASGPVSMGFTGLGASDASISELVFDIASSLAGVGRSVLLVDPHIGGMSAFRDRLGSSSTLSDLVAHDADDAALSSNVSAILDTTTRLGPNLSVLPGNPKRVDAVDTLASKSFRELTEQAISRYDVLMVVGPSALSPFAYVMTGLVSSYVVVSSVGVTRQAHIAELAQQFAGSRSRLVGAVMLGVKPRWGRTAGTSDRRVPAPATTAWADDQTAAQAQEREPVPAGDGGLLDRLGQSLGGLAGDDRE
jgi:Mrp family chromosome partitioning ATPase/capsular polysaccharide biosynthesis protein